MIKFIKLKIRGTGLWGCIAIGIYKFGKCVLDFKIPLIKQFLWIIYMSLDLIFVRGICGAEINPKGKIGKNVSFIHNLNGVMLGGGYSIGDNSIVYHQVTIGVINNKNGSPCIGKNVFIGAGAKILGPIVIGDNAKIGANAVVICDVPENATAVGVPARIISNKKM